MYVEKKLEWLYLIVELYLLYLFISLSRIVRNYTPSATLCY